MLTKARLFVIALVLLSFALVSFVTTHTSAKIHKAEVTVPPCAPPPNNMVGWWPGDGNGFDIRGNNSLTPGLAPLFATAKVGQGMHFVGTSSSGYVAADDPALNFGTGSFSLDAWVSIDTLPDTNGAVLVEKRDNTGKGYVLSADNNGVFTFTVKGDGGFSQVLTSAVSTGSFHHLAVAVNRATGNTVTIYLDSVIQSPVQSVAAIGDTTNTGGLFVGQNSSDSGTSAGPFTGVIDELELFNRALTQTEIQSIVNAGSAGKCRSCTLAPRDLIAWWTGDGDTFDVRGRNNGALQGDATFVINGKVGEAFRFGGNGDFVSIPDSPTLNPTNEITIDAWFQATTTDNFQFLVNKFNVVDDESYALGIDANGELFLTLATTDFPSGKTLQATPPASILDGQFHHVAGTYDGATMKLYSDGSLIGSQLATGTILSSSTPVMLGGALFNGSPSFFLNGLLDEVELFDRALSVSEIQKIYTADSAGKCKPTCLVQPPNMTDWFAGDGDTKDMQGGPDGTTEGSMGFAVGKVGQSFSFNGTDAAVTAIPSSTPGVMNSLPLTIDAWVKPALRNDVTGTNPDPDFFPSNAVSNDIPGNFGHGFGVNVFAGGSKSTLTVEHDTGFIQVKQDAFPFNADQWYHIAVVYTPGNVKYYVNGAPLLPNGASVTPQAEPDSSDDVFIGKHNDDRVTYETRRFFKGLIDEVEVFNRALDDTEIQQIYNAGLAGKCKSATGNTPVQVGDATITFNFDCTSCGKPRKAHTLQLTDDASEIPIDPAWPGTLPATFLNTGLAYDIQTNTTDATSYDVCFNLPAFTDPNMFPQLRVLHNEDGVLIDRTTFLNTGTKTLCAHVTSLSPFVIAQDPNAPTAAPASITGTVTTADGTPLDGVVVKLNGSGNSWTITDSAGNYHFANVETNNFYTVTPARANFTFSPASRSFSLLADKSDAVFTAIPNAVIFANAIDTPEFFVRQQYLDFLSREPDQGGLEYWTEQIKKCGGDNSCIEARRIDVSAAFFIEQEFQQSGSFIYNLYAGSLGRRPAFAEYSTDRRQVVGGSNLEAEKQSFAESFVERAEFARKYQMNTTAESFVDALIQNVRHSSAVDLSSQRDELVGKYNTGANLSQARALIIGTIADNAEFRHAEYNSAFVLTEYFGYLRRDPEPAGYDFWLNVLNNADPGNYRGMVCSFITSTEYQRRFSTIISHSNSECGR